jgi:hypothetical protein
MSFERGAMIKEFRAPLVLPGNDLRDAHARYICLDDNMPIVGDFGIAFKADGERSMGKDLPG